MDSKTFTNVILTDFSKLSLSFENIWKHNYEVKKYMHTF